jgi:hypothetical protein
MRGKRKGLQPQLQGGGGMQHYVSVFSYLGRLRLVAKEVPKKLRYVFFRYKHKTTQ